MQLTLYGIPSRWVTDAYIRETDAINNRFQYRSLQIDGASSINGTYVWPSGPTPTTYSLGTFNARWEDASNTTTKCGCGMTAQGISCCAGTIELELTMSCFAWSIGVVGSSTPCLISSFRPYFGYNQRSGASTHNYCSGPWVDSFTYYQPPSLWDFFNVWPWEGCSVIEIEGGAPFGNPDYYNWRDYWINNFSPANFNTGTWTATLAATL